MDYIHSFSPISNKDSGVLILGSMPGKESLLKNQYYAHPRNSFWRIIGEMLEFPEGASYLERTNALLNGELAFVKDVDRKKFNTLSINTEGLKTIPKFSLDISLIL